MSALNRMLRLGLGSYQITNSLIESLIELYRRSLN